MEYRKVTLWIPRLRFSRRFSLKSLLVLFLIASLLLGWRRDHLRLQEEINALRELKAAWSVSQVLDEPNTPGFGDLKTAWASATPDGQKEWLVLQYGLAQPIDAVIVHENYNPGAVTKVVALGVDNSETILWEGVDPTPITADRGVSILPVTSSQPVDRIKIYIDSPGVKGWNEIDAVGLRGADGNIHWAQKAKASSTYGSSRTGGCSGYTFTF
jgi:hypothetical protein